MKLRIQENALRLRLTRKDITQLRNRGRVESSIEFALGRSLVYALEGSFQADAVTPILDGHTIRVLVPMQDMAEWLESDNASIQALSETGVQLLIEKDFQCLHQSREVDPDTYPHPLLPST